MAVRTWMASGTFLSCVWGTALAAVSQNPPLCKNMNRIPSSMLAGRGLTVEEVISWAREIAFNEVLQELQTGRTKLFPGRRREMLQTSRLKRQGT